MHAGPTEPVPGDAFGETLLRCHRDGGVPGLTFEILDIGCGAGRHARGLTEAVLDVVGIDPSPCAVTVVGHRDINTVTGSAAVLPTGIGVFDTIVLLEQHRPARWPATSPYRAGRARSSRRPRRPHHCLRTDLYRTDDPIHFDSHQRNQRRGSMVGHAAYPRPPQRERSTASRTDKIDPAWASALSSPRAFTPPRVGWE